MMEGMAPSKAFTTTCNGRKKPSRTCLGNEARSDVDLHVPVPQPYPPQQH